MNVKYIFISLIIVCVFIAGTNENKDLKSKIDTQRVILENKMIKKIAETDELSGNAKTSIKAYPVFTIDYRTVKDKITEENLCPDTISNAYLVQNNENTFYITNCLFSDRLKLYLKNKSSWQKLVKLAEEKSHDVFIFNFSSGGIYETPIIGYLHDNEIIFIDHNYVEYKDINSLILSRYGDIETYKKQMQRMEYESKYLSKIKSFEDAKYIYRNNKSNYITDNVFDTLALTNAIIFEIEECCELIPYQKNELAKNLTDAIKRNDFGKKVESKNLIIFSNTIKYEISKILFFEQYFNYLANEALFDRLCSKASNTIYTHFKEEFKNEGIINYSDSLMREKYIKEVYYSKNDTSVIHAIPVDKTNEIHIR